MPTTITATADQPLEQGVYAVTVGPFVDETGDAVTPSAITWTLSDRAGAAVNGRTGVSVTPGSTVTIVLQGEDLQIADTLHDNRRELLIEWTYDSSLGNDLPGKDALYFEVQPLAGVS